MRYDTMLGWVLTKKEFEECGFTKNHYKDGKKRNYTDEKGIKRPQIETANRACKNNHVEIVVKTLDPRFKNIIEQHFVQLKEQHETTMIKAKMEGSDMTEAAVMVTANTFEVNAPYIRTEIEDYVRKNHQTYIPHYLQAYSISRDSIIGYSKICAFGTWLYGMIRNINTKYETPRDRNRQIRSLRANLIEALDLLTGAGFFEVKIPRATQRFDNWVDDIIKGLSSGRLITDIIILKREGNTNQAKINEEQELAIKKLYKDSAALSIMEVYYKILEIGRLMQWWRDTKTGNFDPPTYGTVRNCILAHKDIWSLERTSAAEWGNNIVPSITREWPKLKNMVWGIDGTAQNENVHYKGKVRQFAYTIQVYDYATFRLLELKVTLGMDEKAETMIEAVKGAILEAGYKPNVLQSDQGPGFNGLKEWCESEGIKCIPAALGIARAKPVELLIGLKDSLVDRFNINWTGGNRTALGQNSHPGDKFRTEGAKQARSYEIAKRELKREVFGEWNNHIIGERESKQCLKTPIELWNELPSDTPKLEHIQLAILCGTKHAKKLTIEGLVIQNGLTKYKYFPPVETDTQLDNAYEVFATIPKKGHREGSQLDIYIIEYGKPAPVFKGNKCWGYWTIKPVADMFAMITKNTENYNKLRAFQELFKERAEEEIKNVDDEFAKLACAPVVEEIAKQPLVGRKRVTPLLDKANLYADEFCSKAGIDIPEPEETVEEETKEFTNTLTGEITTIKITRK